MRKPSLFIVGAPRCGTSAMHDFLQQHPEIFMSTPKEPNFFGSDVDFRFWSRAEERSKTQRNDSRSNCCCAESEWPACSLQEYLDHALRRVAVAVGIGGCDHAIVEGRLVQELGRFGNYRLDFSAKELARLRSNSMQPFRDVAHHKCGCAEAVLVV